MAFNRIVVWLLGSPFHRFLSGSTLALHIRGVRTGRIYEVPVNYVKVQTQERERLLITSQRERTWWRNFRQPVEITITFQGEQRQVVAQVKESLDEVMGGLKAYFQASPGSARHFRVEVDKAGVVSDEALKEIAKERVVIWLD